MIDVHYWPTPNGHKVTIFLEEAGLPYRIVPVHIGKGEQFKPDFLKISPNNRMPAIVDHDPPGGGAPIAVFESGAILIYLGEKTGKFLPTEIRARVEALQWLMWQMGGLGPMSGQANHFASYAPVEIPYAKKRYADEVNRLYGVMDRRLADRPYLAGEYSIADMASYPWVAIWKRMGQSIDEFRNLQRWIDAIRARPAVDRAYQKGHQIAPPRTGGMSEEERKVLFGQTDAIVRQAAKAAAQ
jgi:GST-like protein